jgi:hypothetical protein
MLRVTVDVFSGRPNPTVVLTGALASEALARSRAVARSPGSSEPRSQLGYRGIVFEQLTSLDASRPRAFRLAAGRLSGPGGFTARAADAGLERDILAWFEMLAPQWAGLVRLTLARASAAAPRVAPEPAADLRRGCTAAPAPDEEWWSDGQRIQLSNNCYNYAANYRTDTFAQPGRASLMPFRWLECAEVVRAALTDNLSQPARPENRCPPAGHLAALVIAPTFDFHWYRKGRNGRWTHKIGTAAPTANDNAGQPITDPTIADRGPYAEFCGYFVVVDGHVKIA